MLCRSAIRARIDYECSTSMAKFTPVTTKNFLVDKICDRGSSKEPFLKAATLSILIWAYPREMKKTMGILEMPPFRRVRLLTRDEHAHSFCRCVCLSMLCNWFKKTGTTNFPQLKVNPKSIVACNCSVAVYLYVYIYQFIYISLSIYSLYVYLLIVFLSGSL